MIKITDKLTCLKSYCFSFIDHLYFQTIMIYLAFQARALSAQTAEQEAVRFLVGTQSLKFSNNQVHLVELNEETGNLKTQIFQHPIGEIWSIQASPTEAEKFITCYNTLTGKVSQMFQEYLILSWIY